MESTLERMKLLSRNLCVICHCSYEEPHDYSSDCCHIFMVDLNGDASEEYVENMQPTIRILGRFSDYRFCGLGQNLYIFSVTSVYKYNLGKHDMSSCLVLDETSMKNNKVASMPEPDENMNMFLKTIATPDGKIIVLSTSNFFYFPFRKGGFGKKRDSYVFDPNIDPETDKWPVLPEILIRPAPLHEFEVFDGCDSWIQIPIYNRSCNTLYISPGDLFYITQLGFVSESTLLVRIILNKYKLENCLLTLDIHKLKQGWKPYDGQDILYSFDEKYFSLDKLVIVENSHFLKPHGGRSCLGEDFEFPSVREFWGEERRSAIDVVVTDYVEGRECSLANVFSSPYYTQRVERSSTMVVDEFKYDLKQGVCASKNSTPFKFRVQVGGCQLFVVIDSFMMSQPPYPFKSLPQGEGNQTMPQGEGNQTT